MSALNVFLLLTVLFCAENAQALCHQGWVSHGGFCYAYVRGSMSWSEAQAFCHSFGSRLAEPKTATENYFLQQLARSKMDKNVWLGGTDVIHEGTWLWPSTKSTIYLYASWGSGEPNNNIGKEHCMNLWRDKSYNWNDGDCSVRYPFICQYRP